MDHEEHIRVLEGVARDLARSVMDLCAAVGPIVAAQADQDTELPGLVKGAHQRASDCWNLLADVRREANRERIAKRAAEGS